MKVIAWIISILFYYGGCFFCWLFEIKEKPHALFKAYQWCMHRSIVWNDDYDLKIWGTSKKKKP